MVQRLIPHGDKFALVIDRATLDDLKIDPSAPVEVVTDGARLVVVAAGASSAEFDQVIAKMDQRYGTMFRRLAE